MGYANWQLAAALDAAIAAEDPGAARNARRRIRRWSAVLAGMADGSIRVGSRQAVGEFPTWVSLEVARGGFATGRASAGGDLQPHEMSLAARIGIPADRRALFTYYLTDQGLADLVVMLHSGAYRVNVPEEAALLTAAWLVEAGDAGSAVALLDAIEPFAHELRFYPVPADSPLPDPELVARESVAELSEALSDRRPSRQLLAMREAITVWNPFGDELLELWLRAEFSDVAPIDELWLGDARRMLDRYQALAAFHPLCGKHRNRKENLGILVAALQQAVATGALDARQAGRVRTASADMVRRRGAPGAEALRRLRDRQRQQAEQPLYADIARLLVGRLAALPQDRGIEDPAIVLLPVSSTESAVSGVPGGTSVPGVLQQTTMRARAATVEALLAEGVVPSAEVLARLSPQIASATVARAYPDPALQALASANYRAFRARRSLLLLNLERQVRIDELPWVAALHEHRTASDRSRTDAVATLIRLSELTLRHFPGTVLPNPSVQEFAALARDAGLDLPWLEELAADIFTGKFSRKFTDAAKIAADLLPGTLYERYYSIDYRALSGTPTRRPPSRWYRKAPPAPTPVAEDFADLCFLRAGVQRDGGWRPVGANGTVIEQAQILTTHNLATLAGPVGLRPDTGWDALALGAFTVCCTQVGRLQHNPRPLATVKEAAYAWRQMLFYLSMLDSSALDETLAAVEAAAGAAPPATRARLAPALQGLTWVAGGGSFRDDGTTSGGGRRLLGWTTRPHWLMAVEGPAGPR